jgi:hypothetical protein
MNTLGLTQDYFPILPGDRVYEVRLVELPGYVLRKDAPTDENPKAVSETYIPGKKVWQPVETMVRDTVPAECWHRYPDCHTFCQSLNHSHGHQSHAQMH